MPTHIGFLRAVNIGKRQFKTVDLRAALTAAGYADVDTYIQTGNIRVTSPLRSREKLEAELEQVFRADRGFEVPTMVRSQAELKALAAEADDVAREGFEYGHYISLLKLEPTPEAAAALEAKSGNGERFLVRGQSVHLLYDVPYGEAKFTNVQLERTIGVATNRSAKVIREIVGRWC
jgi:uncharacterized protein (DUF1697 family)